MLSILIFLIAIVIANLNVAHFGPVAVYVNAFVLIGLDLTLRDRIHESWHGRNLGVKMFGLICAGAVVTYLLNQGAGMICIASVVAFSCALIADSIVYEKLFDDSKMMKMNYSNLCSAGVDSVLFPTIAFWSFDLTIIIGMWTAKVIGGWCWSWFLSGRYKEKYKDPMDLYFEEGPVARCLKRKR